MNRSFSSHRSFSFLQCLGVLPLSASWRYFQKKNCGISLRVTPRRDEEKRLFQTPVNNKLGEKWGRNNDRY
jgi:hypothetical protein